ncbi:haloacid dehalogenase-like hydrolase domain-containing protein Sgpp [Phoenix dactylifera]|uniref:Haloacid dehalogenase-like hydrolase domain-containing protein Sgpp n=1 Tax=Phoenix dactylifera TaxID=42345 RepID=A0A8B7CHJ6_PHODC|nr:haloacid dehalogenase-like hydrolase domain-containing protein Sgpp [Phoenix dactylifera]
MSDLTNSHAAESSISGLAPLEAVLFDVDGTLCDSDPMHYHAFRELLLEIGYNNGVPITEEDFIEKIAGKHNEDIGKALFPDWDHEKAVKFIDDKEAMFRRLASQQLNAVDGLYKLRKWIEDRGLKCAAVTNAPRPNAELMISILGLSDFFQHVIVGSECERAKPFPDPYLKAVKLLNASLEHSLVFEDSASGIKAGVAAGIPVVGVMTRNPEKSLRDAGASLLIKDYNDQKLWKALEDLERVEATLKKADV